MFGGCADSIEKERHFANAARRFALDAKMFRCRAAVHVENKDDIFFWNALFKHFRPGDRFHFIAGSRNEYGHETYGVTQCLKYFNHLNPHFFICIDSDYRYLLREAKIDVKHCVFQTYTYSFENHHCFAEGLDNVCERVTHLKNKVFDFKRFLQEYSAILYELFIWHLYFMNSQPDLFTRYEFNGYVNLCADKPKPYVYDNCAALLDEWRMQVERKTAYLGRAYPRADLDIVKERYAELGLVPETVYFFVRGHNMYDMISVILKEVCKAMLRRERKNKVVTREMISEMYRNRNSLHYQMKQNLKYGAYPLIRKIEEDIKIFFEEN